MPSGCWWLLAHGLSGFGACSPALRPAGQEGMSLRRTSLRHMVTARAPSFLRSPPPDALSARAPSLGRELAVPRLVFVRVLCGWAGGGSPAPGSHMKRLTALQVPGPCVPRGASLGPSPLFRAPPPWECEVTSLRASQPERLHQQKNPPLSRNSQVLNGGSSHLENSPGFGARKNKAL